eukprot:10407046-Alexandrium_andersonii.AAC.1
MRLHMQRPCIWKSRSSDVGRAPQNPKKRTPIGTALWQQRWRRSQSCPPPPAHRGGHCPPDALFEGGPGGGSPSR